MEPLKEGAADLEQSNIQIEALLEAHKHVLDQQLSKLAESAIQNRDRSIADARKLAIRIISLT